MTHDRRLEDYLTVRYPMNVVAEPTGGYVIEFPDLPGCMTQIEDLGELPAMADEIRALWIETAYELGRDIPAPSYPEEYSGKFNVRLPKSLHRKLAEGADRQGISLNQYIVDLLARGDAQAGIEQRLEALEARVAERLERLAQQVEGVPVPIIQMPRIVDRPMRSPSTEQKPKGRSPKYLAISA